MKEKMFNSMKNYFSAEFIIALANNMDEPNSEIYKAISAIIPTSLAAINKKVQDHSQIVYSLATDASRYYSKAPDVANLQNHGKGSNLPQDIFGDNQHAVTQHIAAYSGLRPGSVSYLIMLVLPVLMGKLGEHIQSENLLDNRLSVLLPDSQEEMNRLLPEEYTLPDFSNHFTATKDDVEKIHDANVARNKTNYVLPKWIPLAIVALIVLLLIYFSRL